MRQTLTVTLAALGLMALSHGVTAQVRPSVFADYASFDAFLSQKVMKREFGAMFQNLGDGANLSLAELQKVTEAAKAAYPVDFEHTAVMRQEELENGFSQEARVFWTGERYAFIYVLLHQRDDELVVVNIAMHGAPGPVLAMF